MVPNTASQIPVVTTNFANNLGSGDSNAQLALDTIDDIDIKSTRQFYAQWSGPSAAGAWASYQDWGTSTTWYVLNDHNHAPHATRGAWMVFENNGNVVDADGNLIVTGSRGNQVNLAGNTVARMRPTLTYTDSGGTSHTVTTSATTSVWKLFYIDVSQHELEELYGAFPPSQRGTGEDMYLGAAARSDTDDVTIDSRMTAYSAANNDRIIVTLAWNWSGTDDADNPTDTVDLKMEVVNSSGNAFTPAIALSDEDVPQPAQKRSLIGTLPLGITAFKIKGTWVAGPADGEIEGINYTLTMDSVHDANIVAGGNIAVTDAGHQTTIGVSVPGPVGSQVVVGSDGLTTSPRFYPESITADSSVQLSLNTGVPTLAQAKALTFTPEIESTASQRTGQVVVVKFNEANDEKDYIIHIGELATNDDVANRHTLEDLNTIGSEAGFSYLSTAAFTLDANTSVYVLSISAYAAQQIRDAVHAAGGETTLTIPDGSIVPGKLKASTDTEKQEFRNKIGAVSVSDFEMQSTFSILGFNAVLSPYTYNLSIAIPANMVKEAAGRPYELQISGSIDGRSTAEDTVVDIEIRSASGTGGTLWATKSITSTSGAKANYTISAMLPPTATNFWVRYNRTGGVAPDGFDGEGYGKVKVGQLAEHVYVDSSGFDGNLLPADDTVQEAIQKLDDLVIPVGGAVPDQTIASTQHNGNASNPAPDANYTINPALVTANARPLYKLHATFNFTVHNQQTLGSSSYEYQLALQADQGTVLDSHTTSAITGGASETFSLTALVPVGTTQLFIRGGRATGSGIGLVHIGGTFHLQAEIDAVNVDVASSGFNGVLSNGDNTVQKALQKVDDYVPNATRLTWAPTVNATTIFPLAAGATVAGLTAYQIGNIVFLEGLATLNTGLHTVPINRLTLSLPKNLVAAIGNSADPYLGDVHAKITWTSTTMILETKRVANITQIPVYFSCVYIAQ